MEDFGQLPARGRSTGQRIGRFVVIGAVIGIAVFLLKVAIFNEFDYGENWLWAAAILAGAIGGGVVGLLLSAAGQDSDDEPPSGAE